MKIKTIIFLAFLLVAPAWSMELKELRLKKQHSDRYQVDDQTAPVTRTMLTDLQDEFAVFSPEGETVCCVGLGTVMSAWFCCNNSAPLGAAAACCCSTYVCLKCLHEVQQAEE